MATCPSCGKEQSGASAFCSACGAVLDRPDTDSALPAPPVTPTQVIPPPVPHAAAAAAERAEDFGDIGQYIARRLMALLVDLVGVTILLSAGIQYLFVRQGQDPHTYGTFFATAVYTLFALIIYLCLSEAYLNTTLGKALFGLRVAPVGGGRVGLVRAVVRNVFLPFDLLVIGFALATLTPRRRRVGDFVAGTEVINAHSGVLGPALAVLILGVWGYAEYAFADGARMAQTLSQEAQTYGPSLIGSQPTTPPGPTPLPERTPVPTEQPITIPTLAPTVAPPSISPEGGAGTAAPPSAARSATPAASTAPNSASASPAPTSATPAASSAANPTPAASPPPAQSPTTT